MFNFISSTPHSNYDKLVRTAMKRLEDFSSEYVYVRSHETRVQYTEEKLSGDWSNCTLYMDGSHIPCRFIQQANQSGKNRILLLQTKKNGCEHYGDYFISQILLF